MPQQQQQQQQPRMCKNSTLVLLCVGRGGRGERDRQTRAERGRDEQADVADEEHQYDPIRSSQKVTPEDTLNSRRQHTERGEHATRSTYTVHEASTDTYTQPAGLPRARAKGPY